MFLSAGFETIQAGARAFLFAEYSVCAIFVVLFAIIILVMTSRLPQPGEPLLPVQLVLFMGQMLTFLAAIRRQ